MLSAFKKLFSKAPQTESPPREIPAKKTTAPAASAADTSSSSAAPADGIPVNLKAVVALMPDAMTKRLDRPLSGKEVIYVSRGDALRQLPSGSVKIPFSEIDRQAPNTFLTPDPDMLATLVNLPLQEILPKIKTLPRRSAQRQVAVPQDLAPVFGTGTEKSREVKAPTAAVPIMTAPGHAAAEVDVAPAEGAPLAIPKPTVRPLPPPPARPIPKAPPVENYPETAPKTLEPQAPISFKLPVPEAPKPVAPPPPAPVAPTPAPTAHAPAPIAPTPVPVAPPPPAPIRVAPVAQPAPAPAAPIRMPAPEPPAVAMPPPTPVPKPAPVPPASLAFAPPPPTPAAAAATAEPVLTFGDIFGQPQKKDWSPQEIVEKAASLRGVAGAMITTVDGLPVAFHLPSNLSGNAVAAFVPQMYTRITQYTRDLKLGDAKHLTILIENVPLQIFRSGSVYFTALGKANENLPKPQLTAIAAALGRPILS